MGDDAAKGEGRQEARGFRVRGRVQGVGFRWWTRTTAEELGLSGTVQNRADGTVEVHAAGPVGRLEELERRLWQGPSSARVEAVDEEEWGPKINRKTFEIIR